MRLLLVAVVFAVNGIAAQTPSQGKTFCFASPPGSDAGGPVWEGRPATGSGATPDEVGRHLAGTWELLSVATEGVQSPHTQIDTLKLVATDTAARFRCPLGRCGRGYSYPLAGQILRAGARFDSAAAVQHRTRDETDAGFSYNATLNTLTLMLGPQGFDMGDFYAVAELSDTTFAGRWESGSFAYAQVSRGGRVLLEKPAGYFCARRIGR
jgi:hypothetical protein